jgi:hypothetical protein
MRPRRRVALRHRRRERYRRSLAFPLVTLPLSGLFLRTAWRNSANGAPGTAGRLGELCQRKVVLDVAA